MKAKIGPGNVAVVTGAADGIGLALSRAFATAGMHVVMSDVNSERLEASANEVRAESDAEVAAIPADVSNPDQVQSLADMAFERFGRVNVLCNNAGVTLPGRRIWNVPREQLEWMFRVNFWGALHGVQAFVPRMLKQGEPAHVVNTASVSGLLGFHSIGGYAATKFAIVGLSESLLLDLRERDAAIDVSVLCPGATATAIAENSQRLLDGGDRDAPRADSVEAAVTTPAEVAAQVVDGIRDNHFWIITTRGYDELLEQRQQAILGGDWEPVAPGFFL
jgi:NAD(P)-dependent dehydrogenase (short-subunit alcohol dehydrogenase family)